MPRKSTKTKRGKSVFDKSKPQRVVRKYKKRTMTAESSDEVLKIYDVEITKINNKGGYEDFASYLVTAYNYNGAEDVAKQIPLKRDKNCTWKISTIKFRGEVIHIPNGPSVFKT